MNPTDRQPNPKTKSRSARQRPVKLAEPKQAARTSTAADMPLGKDGELLWFKRVWFVEARGPDENRWRICERDDGEPLTITTARAAEEFAIHLRDLDQEARPVAIDLQYRRAGITTQDAFILNQEFKGKNAPG